MIGPASTSSTASSGSSDDYHDTPSRAPRDWLRQQLDLLVKKEKVARYLSSMSLDDLHSLYDDAPAVAKGDPRWWLDKPSSGCNDFNDDDVPVNGKRDHLLIGNFAELAGASDIICAYMANEESWSQASLSPGRSETPSLSASAATATATSSSLSSSFSSSSSAASTTTLMTTTAAQSSSSSSSSSSPVAVTTVTTTTTATTTTTLSSSLSPRPMPPERKSEESSMSISLSLLSSPTSRASPIVRPQRLDFDMLAHRMESTRVERGHDKHLDVPSHAPTPVSSPILEDVD